MKTHLNLGTAHLDRSVTFYRTLLHADPLKHYDDYALFVSDDPGLELALDRNPGAKVADCAHYGVVVDSVDAVDAAIKRLVAAGFPTDVEREKTCCYANQTKVWTRDPDGRRWEVYFVHEETSVRDDATTRCCEDETGDSCCAA